MKTRNLPPFPSREIVFLLFILFFIIGSFQSRLAYSKIRCLLSDSLLCNTDSTPVGQIILPLGSSCAEGSREFMFGWMNIDSTYIWDILIFNCGKDNDTFSPEIIGEGYTLLPYTNHLVTPGSYLRLDVKFNPTECRAYPGILRIRNEAGAVVLDVPLEGGGRGAVYTEIDNKYVKADLNTTTYYNIGLINKDAEIHLGPPVTTGPFKIGKFDFNQRIISNGYCSIPIEFTPTQSGFSDGTLTFPNISPRYCGDPIVIHLKGYSSDITPVCMQPNHTEMFTTTTYYGARRVERLVLANCGKIAAAFTPILSGRDYSFVNIPDTTQIIQPGDSAVYEIAFEPIECGYNDGTLTITTLRGDPISIKLVGKLIYSQYAIYGTTTLQAHIDSLVADTLYITNHSQVGIKLGKPLLGKHFFAPELPKIFSPNRTIKLPLTFISSESGIFYDTLSFPEVYPKECFAQSIPLIGIASPELGLVRESGNECITEQNFPNPFKVSTVIMFTIPKRNKVNVSISNVNGKIVKTLLEKELDAGSYNIECDMRDFLPGIYFYTIVSGGTVTTRPMTLIK